MSSNLHDDKDPRETEWFARGVQNLSRRCMQCGALYLVPDPGDRSTLCRKCHEELNAKETR